MTGGTFTHVPPLATPLNVDGEFAEVAAIIMAGIVAKVKLKRNKS